jgi:hypothetical protein
VFPSLPVPSQKMKILFFPVEAAAVPVAAADFPDFEEVVAAPVVAVAVFPDFEELAAPGPGPAVAVVVFPDFVVPAVGVNFEELPVGDILKV